LNIGMRHISLSTCGKLDNLDKLLELNLQLTLSLSLHAPNDEIRSQLMPVNSRWGVEKIVTICKHYFLKTGRRISYEYAMIKGINDSEDNAYELARLLNQGIPQHVNLIPINNVSENDFEPSAAHDIEKFKRILEKHGITATVRRKLGSDIDASCGQLRRKNINERG